jgi:hypothetical protein
MMSQSLKNFDNAEKGPATETLGAAGLSQPQETRRSQIQVDDSKVTAIYASFCRIAGTPEELIIDFGLNPLPSGTTDHPILVTQRIVLNYFTAKRVLYALQQTIERHEGVFGVLETDVQRRVQMRPAQS